MEGLIGNTPLIQIRYRYMGEENFVYVKLEQYNITGSIKDRIAYYMIKKAKKEGLLPEGKTIVEATSGNTGIAFAAIGAYFHHPVVIYMPDWVSSERISLIRSYGAQVYLVSREEGGFLECIKRAQDYAISHQGYLPSQFSNLDNLETHYFSTGQEIIRSVPEKIGGFVSGIGTGGTLMGVGKALREQNPDCMVIALEPKSSPLLTEGKIGIHKIEGIGDDFVPELVSLQQIDDVVLIDDRDAMAMAQKIACSLGIGVGISSGANLLAAIMYKKWIQGAMVTIFVDDQKKYMSTALNTSLKSTICDKIELLDFKVCKER